MFETAGTLTIVELASSLVLLVLLPFLWAVVAAVAALRGRGGQSAARLAIAIAGATLGLAVAHAVRAALLPRGHVAAQHVAQLARIGQLDLSIELVRDPTSATLAVLVAFLAFIAVLHAVSTAERGLLARLAWTGLATGATLLVVLADGLPALAVGLQLATIAGWALAGGRGARPLGLALAGDTAVVFAAWILFWSLGGTFGTSGYAPDTHGRFGLVALPDAPRADGMATVALTTYAGALVSSDEGPPLPGEPLRAPFTVTLAPGSYSFQIEAGAATSELLVTHVTLAPGRAYVLTPYGPTTSLRLLSDELAVPRPTIAGPLSVRATLASRFLSGLHVPTLLGIVALLAMLLRTALLARDEGGGLAFAIEAVPPVALLLHVAPLLDAPVAAALGAGAALAAVVFAADAASARSRSRAPRAALGALVALALAALLLGETAAAVTLLVVATLGTAAATAAVTSDADVRWLGLACAGLAGILPGAGASPALGAVALGAFGASAAGRWAGGIAAPLVTVAVILVSLALFRVYGASLQPGVKRAGSRASRALVIVLAVASVSAGVVLGAGTSPFGGQTAPLARRLVSPGGGLDGVPRMVVAGLALSVAAAAIGLAAARRATRTPVAPAWLGALGAPVVLASKLLGAGVALLRFFVRSVVIMNEDVIDDATEVLAAGVLAVGCGVRRVDRFVARGVLGRALGRGAGELVVRTGIDDPRRFERLRLALLIGMVAILGLVVLCSLVLG
jgi:hypothetical protein